MASETVYTAIKNHLIDAYRGIYPVLDFDEIDRVLEDEAPVAFLSLEEITSSEDVVGIGNPASLCYEENGALVVHAFVLGPEASNLARKIVDGIREVLRSQTIESVRIESVSPAEQELLNEGMWAAAATAISYSYNFHATG